MKNIVLIVVLLLMGATTHSSFAQDGEKLFVNNCKACHALDKRLVGPPLAGITERRDIDWIRKFIRGSQAMIKAGDPTAVALFEEYNHIIMPDQSVTDAEIDAILNYIKSASKPKSETAHAITRPEPHWAGNTSRPMRFSDVIFWLPFTLSVFGVIALLYYLISIADYKREQRP